MMGSLRKQVISGVLWRFAEQFGTQIITFVVSIILARLLGPEEFGTVALLTIFMALSQCLVNSGFGTALIQKKDADDLDFNSVFYLSLAISILMYVCLRFDALLVTSFYEISVLLLVFRMSAFRLIFDGLSGAQNPFPYSQFLDISVWTKTYDIFPTLGQRSVVDFFLNGRMGNVNGRWAHCFELFFWNGGLFLGVGYLWELPALYGLDAHMGDRFQAWSGRQ